MLEGVNVALGVTGSIAAVRTVELVHELRRRGASVRAVTTEAARGIVHPWALEFATENEVVTEVTGAVEHVELCGADGWADVFCVAPATGNTVGKMAAAIDDTPVTTTATTAIGADVPVVLAPAMHQPMYDHPGVHEALDHLAGWGVQIVPPRFEEGKAKIAGHDAIATALARATTDDPLAGEHVVVTAGATREAIDPVRTLTNRSSGRTGRAVARACYVRGADVTLIHGAAGNGLASDDDPEATVGDAQAGGDLPYATLRVVESATDMTEAALAVAGEADALISAAAIGDYTVEERAEKIRSGQETLTLELTPTPKLIDSVRESEPDLPMVGFKAEVDADDQQLVDRAWETKQRVDLAFVVANDASVMEGERTRALIVRSEDVAEYEGDKAGLGELIAEEMATVLG